MKLITERTLVRDVAAKWRATYYDSTYGRDKLEIRSKLDALDPETATAAEVSAIIGNGGWTEVPECDECHASTAAVMQLGEEPDYESRTVNVCGACLHLALAAYERDVNRK